MKFLSFSWRKLVLLSFFVSAILFLKPTLALGQGSIYMGPSTGTFTVGSTFTVSVYLNTGDQFVNAI